MSFDRSLLPDPLTYYSEEAHLPFVERHGKWRTAPCPFHGGSDSLRVNTQSGAFVCMAGCGASGGDVLAYHMRLYGLDFVTAARDLGCWADDGKGGPTRPLPLTVRDAMTVLAREVNLAAIAAGNLANGVTLTDADRARLLTAAGRINRIAEIYS